MITTTIEPQPAILAHHCGECGYGWQERKYPRRDGSYHDAVCPMCAAKQKPAGEGEHAATS